MLHILCPAYCIFCDALTYRTIDLCATCERELPVLQNYCRRCAEPLPLLQKICGACLGKKSPVIITLALFHYASPIDLLITQLKFMRNLAHAMLLGKLLKDYLVTYYLSNPKPEVVIPVPLHPQRLRERGYNQALELAWPSIKALNLPVDKFSLERIKYTFPQVTLAAKERKQNVRHAFFVRHKLPYRHVAVIDDVVTTGNTIMEVCKTLYKAGIQKIDIWCLARSSKNSNFL